MREIKDVNERQTINLIMNAYVDHVGSDEISMVSLNSVRKTFVKMVSIPPTKKNSVILWKNMLWRTSYAHKNGKSPLSSDMVY